MKRSQRSILLRNDGNLDRVPPGYTAVGMVDGVLSTKDSEGTETPIGSGAAITNASVNIAIAADPAATRVELEVSSPLTRSAAQGKPLETNAGTAQLVRNVARDPGSDTSLTVTVTGVRLATSPVVISVPVLASDASTDAGTKLRAALAANATVTAAYTVTGSGNFVDLLEKAVAGAFYGRDDTMAISVQGTGYNSGVAAGSSIVVVGVPTTTETAAEAVGQICRVGDAEPYDWWQAISVSPTKWRRVPVTETGVTNSYSPTSYVIRNAQYNNESRDANKWELFNLGANASPELALHTVPSSFGRNNWSHLWLWNMAFDQPSKSWKQSVDTYQTQAIELGQEGISMHMVKDGGDGFGFNTVSHMMWAMRPGELHSGTGELHDSYQTENPVIQRKISDICIFREVDGSSTPNSDGWVDLDNPFAVYASDSRNNIVPPNGSIAFRTWGTQDDGQMIVFDRASGPAATQAPPVSGQKLGGIRYRVWDGASWIGATSIHAEVAGDVDTDDAPIVTVIDGEDRDDGNVVEIRKAGTTVASVSRNGSVRADSLNVEDWPVFADEASAIAGGVQPYHTYRTADGALRYVYTATYDPDAQNYIGDLETALSATLDTADKEAIDTFVTAEKAAGRWTAIKRLWLPVWNNASANAVDMKGGTAGAFVGTVTHSAGYVQGDGSSGYFDTNASASGLSLTNSSAFVAALIYQAGSGTSSQAIIGAYPAGTGALLLNSTGTFVQYTCMDNSAAKATFALARASEAGIITASRFGGSHTVRKRNASGVTSIGTSVIANAGTVPTTDLFAMAYNNFGSPAQYSDARFGTFLIADGLSTSDTDALTANLKTMWEAITGLTLP